jgi:hypothetical protein
MFADTPSWRDRGEKRIGPVLSVSIVVGSERYIESQCTRGRPACKILPYTLSSPTPQKVESAQGIFPQLDFPIYFKNRTPLLVAVQKEAAESPTPAVVSEESEPAILHRNDFVLLNDEIKCWIVRIEDISLLEACCIFLTFRAGHPG